MMKLRLLLTIFTLAVFTLSCSNKAWEKLEADKHWVVEWSAEGCNNSVCLDFKATLCQNQTLIVRYWSPEVSSFKDTIMLAEKTFISTAFDTLSEEAFFTLDSSYLQEGLMDIPIYSISIGQENQRKKVRGQIGYPDAFKVRYGFLRDYLKQRGLKL